MYQTLISSCQSTKAWVANLYHLTWKQNILERLIIPSLGTLAIKKKQIADPLRASSLKCIYQKNKVVVATIFSHQFSILWVLKAGEFSSILMPWKWSPTGLKNRLNMSLKTSEGRILPSCISSSLLSKLTWRHAVPSLSHQQLPRINVSLIRVTPKLWRRGWNHFWVTWFAVQRSCWLHHIG